MSDRPMCAQYRLALVGVTPWWVLHFLWRTHIVKRTTVFRWEMNAFLGEWDSG